MAAAGAFLRLTNTESAARFRAWITVIAVHVFRARYAVVAVAYACIVTPISVGIAPLGAFGTEWLHGAGACPAFADRRQICAYTAILAAVRCGVSKLGAYRAGGRIGAFTFFIRADRCAVRAKTFVDTAVAVGVMGLK